VLVVVLGGVVLLTLHIGCGHTALGGGRGALGGRGGQDGLSLPFHFLLVHPGGSMSDYDVTTLNTQRVHSAGREVQDTSTNKT